MRASLCRGSEARVCSFALPQLLRYVRLGNWGLLVLQEPGGSPGLERHCVVTSSPGSLMHGMTLQALYKEVRRALQTYYVKQVMPSSKAIHKGPTSPAPSAQWYVLI